MLFCKRFGVMARQTPKPPFVLSLCRRLRGVDEPLAVTPNIYASTRLARTQARLPLKCYSTLVTLQRCGRRAAEPRKALFYKTLFQGVPLEIGSDSLMSGPQTFFLSFGEDFESATIRNIKSCVGNFSVRACFFKKIGQFLRRPRRSDVTLKPAHSVRVRKF